jgi:hypothetical protein
MLFKSNDTSPRPKPSFSKFPVTGQYLTRQSDTEEGPETTVTEEPLPLVFTRAPPLKSYQSYEAHESRCALIKRGLKKQKPYRYPARIPPLELGYAREKENDDGCLTDTSIEGQSQNQVHSGQGSNQTNAQLELEHGSTWNHVQSTEDNKDIGSGTNLSPKVTVEEVDTVILLCELV